VPHVFGYARESLGRDDLTTEAQKGAVREYVLANPGLPDLFGFYVDTNHAAKVRLCDRAAGGVLYHAVERGDAVIVADLRWPFQSIQDMHITLGTWRNRGASFHVVGLGAVIGGQVGTQCDPVAFMRALVGLKHDLRSEWIKDGLLRRRAKGQRTNPWPGYGCRWVETGETGTRANGARFPLMRREWDEQELQIMAGIHARRSRHPPMPWDQIVRELAGVTTRDGYRWDSIRIRRAHKAFVALQDQLTQHEGAAT
jgi:hypothetical protein